VLVIRRFSFHQGQINATMTDIADKRNSMRRRTIFGGVIFRDDGRSAECSVSDISETGVKVATKEAFESGSEVDLKINKYKNIHRCEVTWIRGNEIGLRFLLPLSKYDEELAGLFKFSHF